MEANVSFHLVTPVINLCSHCTASRPRFFNHGASRLLRNICGPTVGAGLSMTNGNGKSLDPMEIEHSRLIVLWE